MTVTLQRLDHVNIRTANLDAMVAWYRDMLGLETGPRPGFAFPGAWLYAGEHAIVHLIGRDVAPADPQQDLHLEHFAIRATGLHALIGRARGAGARMEVRKVPDFPIVQVNLWDPDGNHLHVDFDAAEAEGLDLA